MFFFQNSHSCMRILPFALVTHAYTKVVFLLSRSIRRVQLANIGGHHISFWCLNNKYVKVYSPILEDIV